MNQATRLGRLIFCHSEEGYFIVILRRAKPDVRISYSLNLAFRYSLFSLAI